MGRKQTIGLNNESFSEKTVEAGRTLIQEQNEQRNGLHLEDDVYVSLPNSGKRRLSEIVNLIDHEYVQRDFKAVFTEVNEYLKEPKEGYHYAWPAIHDRNLLARVRSGVYRPVKIEEIREDTSAPIEVKPKAGEDFVCIGDVVLVELSPRAYKAMYKDRELEAILATVRNQSFAALKQNVENMSRGAVSADLKIQEID